VTSRCNLRCPFCFRDAGAPGPGEFDTERMTALVRTLAAIGVHELRLTGGKPTVRRDILAIIDEAVAQGLFVTLNTNGVFPAEMLADLAARKVGRYLVSLEGVRPVHEAMRGLGTFEPTMRTIDGLVAAGKRVRVNTLLARPSGWPTPRCATGCSRAASRAWDRRACGSCGSGRTYGVRFGTGGPRRRRLASGARTTATGASGRVRSMRARRADRSTPRTRFAG